MQFYVPELKDKIELLKDWEFSLYHERRNSKFFEMLTGRNWWDPDLEDEDGNILDYDEEANMPDPIHEVLKRLGG